MNRRSFLQTASILATAGPVTSPAADAAKPAPKPVPPLVGSQLYGWGQYYQRDGKDLNAHLGEVFKALKDCGYDYAEGNLDVSTPANNGKFADRLRKHGLKAVSLYTGGPMHVLGKATETAERIARGAKEAAKAGFGIINVNPDPIGRPKTEKELAIQSDALTELGDWAARIFAIDEPKPMMLRETPLHLGHIRAMAAATEAGAILAPPVPAFYAAPRTLEDLVDHAVGRCLDLFGIETDLVRRWGEPGVDGETPPRRARHAD